MRVSLKGFFVSLWQEIITVSFSLFKIMVPVIIIIKILEELGAVSVLAEFLAPLMSLLGLPDAVGLAWAATMFSNIYSGLLVLSSLNLETPLSVAQVSVLGSMMLLAHSLPIEVTIAKKAGVSILLTLFIRIGGGLLFAYLLHLTYSHFNLLQQPAHSLLTIESSGGDDLLSWGLEQLKSLAYIFLAICGLLFSLRILRILGIERLMSWLLQPLLKLLGISPKSTNLAIIGITLGMSFGGGLLLNEARKGDIAAKDIFAAIMLLNLVHSLIEDTLIILLVGADFYAIFWGRLLFSLVVIAGLMQLVNRLGNHRCEPWLYRSVKIDTKQSPNQT